MTQRENKIFHNCRIVRKSQEEYNGNEVWTVTLDKEAFGGKWDSDITRVKPEIANRLERGQQYNLILERENKKKAEYDGERDWMFYWGLVGIADGDAAQQAETTTNGAAPRQTAPTPSVSLDERIAWNSAINNAVSAVPFERDAVVDWTVEIRIVAHHIYTLIRMGPSPDMAVDDAPSEPPESPEAPEAPERPSKEDIQYLKEMLDADEDEETI